MPQKLKEEVRQEILKNALECFLDLGYNNTSMKLIAQASGISVGNIYNYFKDKEALYDTLAFPVFERINGIFDKLPKPLAEGVDEKARAFAAIYKSNKKVFVMLLENSSNTKFENLKQKVIENFSFAIVRFIKTISKKEVSDQDNIFIEAYTCSIINGAISILKHESDEEKKLEVLFRFISTMKNALIDTLKIKEE